MELLGLCAQTAKGVSATARRFDAEGRERDLDYSAIIATVLDAGFRGYVGIDYRGDELGELAGIAATRNLLAAVRAAHARREES